MADGERTEAGRVEVRGEESFLTAIRPVVDLARRQGRHGAGVVEEGGVRAYFKHGPLPPRAGLRHGLRALWPGLDVPCLQEFDNLCWLRRNGFHAPRPLAAGCYRNGIGVPVHQFLYTEAVPASRTLRQVFTEGPVTWRAPALEELGAELARLHGRGFTHHDLFPRNLLVSEEDDRVLVHFLDAWRGGPLPGLRGPSYDVACLMLFGVDLFASSEQRAFLDAYFRERTRLGHRVSRAKFLRAAVRQRHALRRRFVKRRREGSVLPIPSEEWTP